jgi:hypothetical protein
MGVKPQIFLANGKASQHLDPGAFSDLNFLQGAGGAVSINRGVILGDSRGGLPNTLLWFTSDTQARDTLRSGPLLDAVIHAFDPGNDLRPQAVAAWRVNPGLKAGFTVQGNTGAINLILLTAWDNGLHGNQVKFKLEPGTNAGKKLTMGFQANTPIVLDDIDRPSITVRYNGTCTTATCSISKTDLTTSIDGGGGLSVPFASFPTLDDVVNYINDQANYVATLLGTGSSKSTELDVGGSVVIKATTATFKSTLQAIIDAFASMPWIGSALFNTGAASRAIPDNYATYTYLTGGTDGAYTSSEMTAALTLLEQENVQLVGTSSEDAAFHLLVKSHCEKMNSRTGKSERQFIVGGAAGESVSAFQTRCVTLNSTAGMCAYPGFVFSDFNDPTKTKTWSPAYYAARLLGQAIAVAPNEPLTNKQLSHFGWEKTLTQSEIESCIALGGCVGKRKKDGSFVTARSINTYQGSELAKCEFSMMREALFMARDLRSAIENVFIGRALTLDLLGFVDAVFAGKMALYKDMGLVVADQNHGNRVYWGYVKSVNGDTVRIEYSCNLVAPFNFAFIVQNMGVFASTFAAAA